MTPSQALAHVLVDELARCGVRHVVLCPGSRSAPLAYALLAADRAGSLRLHVRVDERSAAFLALGLARGSGHPAAVVTTSGTAVANLHPAVLEAHESGVPLLVITADRPPELRGTRANQTTDQVGIFGGSVRWSHDLGAPERRPGQVGAWRSSVDRAVAAATGTLGGEAGPAHLNVPLREPLAPEAVEPAESAGWPEPLAGRPAAAPWTAVVAAAPWTAVGRPAGAADDGPAAASGDGSAPAGPTTPAPPPTATPPTTPVPTTAETRPAARPSLADPVRTLVVLGELDDNHPGPLSLRSAAVVDTAARLGWPVVAEPFGTAERSSVIAHGPLVLAVPGLLRTHPPQRILLVGRVTLSRATAALLRTPEVRVEAVSAGPRWADPSHVVQAVYPWSAWRDLQRWAEDASPEAPRTPAARPTGEARSPGQMLPIVEVAPTGQGSPTDEARWVDAWTRAASDVHTLVCERLEAAWPGDAEPPGAALAHAVLAALPPGASLFVGSSNSARDVETARGPRGPQVLANRGLAGIDGCLSTAVGLALARPGVPTYALVGDLTFVHDANALVIGPGEPVPDLTIVVADDRGGGIFATLEYGDPARRALDPAGYERVFATPTGTDLGALAAAHGVPSARVTSRRELREALTERPRGLRVVHVPIRRDSRRADDTALRVAVAEGVSIEPGNG